MSGRSSQSKQPSSERTEKVRKSSKPAPECRVETSALFPGICDWLLDRALREYELSDTVRGLGQKLVEGGLPVCRINVGGLLLHPVLGALDMTWESGNGTCLTHWIPRSADQSPMLRNAPFYPVLANGIAFERHRLDDPAVREKFPLFRRLGDSGVTDYIIMFETYRRTTRLDWAELPPSAQGAVFSIATKRIGGFTNPEIASLRQLAVPFALAVKMATDRSLAKTLLETYLGRISGGRVLSGLVERGEGRVIDCALWLSDLRDSTAMSAQLDIDAYFSAINDYFDCTAGAVLEHGGEVLKFIGDAVMAIFPFEDSTRPASDMCTAAVMTARESLARVSAKNRERTEQNLTPIEFGIGLHVGRVMYGNVGTERRLDLTVTGSAANEVQRVESLCKRLSVPVVASETFATLYPGSLISLGRQDAAGICGGLDALTLPEFASALPKAVPK